jgi:hypothetical protein
MEIMRARAKENLPHVLLTLLSIIQALALELLWSRVREAPFLYDGTWAGGLSWLQVASLFLGIVVIWVVYVHTVLRFRWLPGIWDSVHPFVVGGLQFLMIETLGPGQVGVWLLLLAAVFAVMFRVSHTTLRRARAEPENAEFFSQVPPATWRDFYGAYVSVGALSVLGGIALLVPGSLVVAGLGLLVALGLLVWQLAMAFVFWERSMRRDGPR